MSSGYVTFHSSAARVAESVSCSLNVSLMVARVSDHSVSSKMFELNGDDTRDMFISGDWSSLNGPGRVLNFELLSVHIVILT